MSVKVNYLENNNINHFLHKKDKESRKYCSTYRCLWTNADIITP